MAILIIPGKFNPNVWATALLKIDPTLDIQIWPQVKNPAAIEFALVWRYPQGELSKFPNLKCISSMGAGVDHIMSDPQLPKHVPIVRIVDEMLMRDMTQYIVLTVLDKARNFDHYRIAQQQHLWTPTNNPKNVNVGIMGLGQLGSDAAIKLQRLGFNVAGWSRSHKKIANIESFAGEAQFNHFLARTNILICLLPLTVNTRGILNSNTFSQLPKGAYIINVARGEHLVEEDLIAALASGQLSGACLDVFHAEPLPKDHPFWQCPNIKITPHIASVTDADSAAQQVIINYKRAISGQPLLQQINLTTGY